MKFKNFLKELEEKYIAGNRKKEWEMMIEGYMPLSPSLLKDFETFVPKAYHITNFKNVENVIKSQNKKIDIATFTKGSVGISYGAIAGGDVMFTLEGYSSFRADVDFKSEVDRNGHRWLSPSYDDDNIVNNLFTVPMKKAIVKEYNLDNRLQISDIVVDFDGQEMNKFIKFYFDTAKKLITSTLLKKLKTSLANTYSGAGYTNDEVLLHKYKIKKIDMILDEDRSKSRKETLSDDFYKMYKIKLNGFILREDIKKLGN